jgi:hypothetical protein
MWRSATSFMPGSIAQGAIAAKKRFRHTVDHAWSIA